MSNKSSANKQHLLTKRTIKFWRRNIKMEDCTMAFSVLKPICDKIVHGPSKENTGDLIKLLRQKIIPNSAIQQLQDYLLFPLDLHLKVLLTKQEIRLHLVDCITEIFDNTFVDSLPKLFSTYSLLFRQIFDKNTTGFVAEVSEELKCSVLNCVIMLVKKSTIEVTYRLYDKTNVPKLSQGIYMCVHLAQFEKSRTVKLAAIECIATLSQVHNETFLTNAILCRQVGDFLMFLLPGIVGGLIKVILGDEKQGHKVTMMALRTWSRIIATVMDDDYIKPSDVVSNTNVNFSLNPSSQDTIEHEDSTSNIYKNGDREGMLEYLTNQSRSSEWTQSSAKKLAPLTEKIIVLQNNQHWLVRRELVAACSLLLLQCPRNLELSIITFLEILIMSSEDDNELVSSQSKDAITSFMNNCQLNNSKSLLEILEENFFSLVTKLPRILHSKTDVEQLSVLRLLSGYLRALGHSKLPEVLNVTSHLHRLVMTLIYVVELDNSDVSLLEEYSVRDLNYSQIKGLNRPWKKFRHFTDKMILIKIQEICQILGDLGDVAILSDYFLDIFHNCPQHKKEIVLILNEIVCSSHMEQDSHSIHIISNVLDVYLEPSTWNFSLVVGGDSGLTIAQAQSNLILACLLVEGLGKIAFTLGKAFDRFLLRTLYMVLERAGSSNGLLSSAGISAVECLAFAGGHKNITSLVNANVDYFSYHVTMKLRRYEQNPGVLDVLNVVMKYSTIDVLPCIQDIVNDILLQSCDTFQGKSTVAFLRVFHTFVMCVRRWLIPAKNTKTEPAELKLPCPDFKKELKDFQEAKSRIDSFLENDEYEEKLDEPFIPEEHVAMNEDIDGEEYVKKKVPGYIQMTVSVLKRCLHFLPANNKDQKLIVLETLNEGVQILSKWEDELLPVVHLIWSPLIGRFREDPIIINRSFSLLSTLAQTSKDFISARTYKDVLPSIYKFLESSAIKSYKKDSGSAYRFTQDYKLQKELLDGMGILAINLYLPEKEIDDLMMAALPYASHFQPVPLQDRCVKLFKQLATYDLGSVLAKVISMLQPNNDNIIYKDIQKNAKVIYQFCNKQYC